MAIGLTTNTVQTGGGSATKGDTITNMGGPYVYDKGVQLSVKPRVLKAQFGDGYEMRVRDGINTTPRSWTLTFNNRLNEDIDNLYAFFDTLASVDTCQLTVPDQTAGGNEEAIIVVIEEYTKTYAYDQFYSLTCRAREVFEV